MSKVQSSLLYVCTVTAIMVLTIVFIAPMNEGHVMFLGVIGGNALVTCTILMFLRNIPLPGYVSISSLLVGVLAMAVPFRNEVLENVAVRQGLAEKMPPNIGQLLLCTGGYLVAMVAIIMIVSKVQGVLQGSPTQPDEAVATE